MLGKKQFGAWTRCRAAPEPSANSQRPIRQRVIHPGARQNRWAPGVAAKELKLCHRRNPGATCWLVVSNSPPPFCTLHLRW